MNWYTGGWNKKACLLTLNQNVRSRALLRNEKPKPLYASQSLRVHKLHFISLSSNTQKPNICFMLKSIILRFSVVTRIGY